jgi:hypothetical protein
MTTFLEYSAHREACLSFYCGEVYTIFLCRRPFPSYRCRQFPLMNAKMLFRAFVFLALSFAVLYIGMTNTHRIDFYFPVLFENKITQRAAIIFFAMFAIGVVAGMMLHSASGGGGKNEGAAKKR